MNHPNPWRGRSRTSVYRNDWIEVINDEVKRPDGSDGVFHDSVTQIGLLRWALER